MKAQDLKLKSDDELVQELLSLRKEQFNLRFQKSGGQLEKTSRIRDVRRTIARIKTIQEQRLKGIAANDVKKPAKAAKPKAEKPKAEKKEKKTAAKKPAAKKTAKKK